MHRGQRQPVSLETRLEDGGQKPPEKTPAGLAVQGTVNQQQVRGWVVHDQLELKGLPAPWGADHRQIMLEAFPEGLKTPAQVVGDFRAQVGLCHSAGNNAKTFLGVIPRRISKCNAREPRMPIGMPCLSAAPGLTTIWSNPA